MSMKRKRKKNRILPMACALGIFIGSICNSYMNVYAEALPNFPEGVDLVSAADCIMSYLTSAGMFISNRDWLDELYTSFGGSAGFYIDDLYQNGLLTLDEAGHYVSSGLDTALENQSAWSSLHLDELFNVSAQEAAAGGGVAATGAGTIAGCIGGVATTGALPLAIGVTGAYWGGIGLGTLIAHALGLYGKNVILGAPITMTDVLQSLPENSNHVMFERVTGQGDNRRTRRTYIYGDGVPFAYPNGQYYTTGILNINNSPITVYRFDLVDGFPNYEVNRNVNSGSEYTVSTEINGLTLYLFPNLLQAGEYNTKKQQWINGASYVNNPRRSPDIITQDGNAIGEYSQSGGITIPSLIPQVNPNEESIRPSGADETAYQRWADAANNNTANGDEDENGDILQEILEAIRTLTPSPGVNPNPNPNPNPTPVPKPDYDPNQPDQPEYDPKETEGPDDVTNGSPWTTPDLLDKFPFCLPRDVLRCFEKLDGGSRQAPSISWHFTTPLGIHFDFDLDLDDYEGIASLLRTLELIAFVIGLALATRNLIGR